MITHDCEVVISKNDILYDIFHNTLSKTSNKAYWVCRQNTTVFGLKSQYVIILICPLNSLRVPEVGRLFLILFLGAAIVLTTLSFGPVKDEVLSQNQVFIGFIAISGGILLLGFYSIRHKKKKN